jgi:ribosomal protein S18 acetylase RimI-like enzyme
VCYGPRVTETSVSIRPATKGDLPRLGELAGELVRLHHRTDPRRFLLVDDVETGYARWFAREMGRKGAIVLVAEQDGAVIGYGYATIEGRDWASLLDDHGALHDVLVDASARRSGAGKALVLALCKELEALGARRIVLKTMVQNEAAQRLFAACGFRSTMLEMTRG